MKKIIITLLIAGFTSAGYAQGSDRDPKAFGLTASADNRNVYLEWKGESTTDSYWVVEGGRSVAEMNVVGYVMGADPKAGFRFKQELGRMKKGLKYFRVVEMRSERAIAASNVVMVAK